MRLLALLATAALLAPAAAADWPQFHGDERNRGLGPSDYATHDAVWWTVDPGVGRIEASPVVADGILVVAGSTGKVVAMDASTGAQKWNKTMPKGVVGTPAIDNGWLYVVDEGGTLKSFDLQTGFDQKTASVGPTLAGITVHEGSVYVGNEKGEVFRFEAQSLTQAWKFDTGSVYKTRTVSEAGVVTCTDKLTAGAVRSVPAVYKGKVVFGSFNNYVYAVSEFGTGELQWIHKTDDLVLSSPVVDQDRDRFLVGSYDRKVVALPLSGGTVQDCGKTAGNYATSATPAWTYTVPSDVGNSAVRATPAIHGETIVVGALNGHVYGVSATTGKQVWDHNSGAAITGSPAVANNLVVAPNDAGRLVWLHVANGTEVKRHEAEAPLRASPALVQDRTYIATFPGKVSLLGAGFPKRPDLAVDMPQREGNDVLLTVRNTGDGAADPTILRVHLDGEFLADLNVTGLPAGGVETLRHAIDLQPPFTVKATVDPLNAVAETDEDDNSAEASFAAPAESTPDPSTETPDPGSDPDPTTPGTTDRPEGIPGPALGLLLAGIAALAWLGRRAPGRQQP